MVEQEFEIKRRIEENDSLMQFVESISRASVGKTYVYNNGSMSASSSVHSDASSNECVHSDEGGSPTDLAQVVILALDCPGVLVAPMLATGVSTDTPEIASWRGSCAM